MSSGTSGQPGGIFSIPSLPGGSSNNAAQGVSADGARVVGTDHSASGPEAFLWSESTGTIGLGDLPSGEFNSPARAISADGSTIVGEATGISADGQTIVGWGSDPAGSIEARIATIPEPSTGLMALAAGRRRRRWITAPLPGPESG